MPLLLEVAKFIISLKFKGSFLSKNKKKKSLSLFCLCFSTSFCSSSHQISIEESFYPIFSVLLMVFHFSFFLLLCSVFSPSILSWFQFLVATSPSPVTFQLKHAHRDLPILPLKLLWTWIFLSIRISLQTSTELTQKNLVWKAGTTKPSLGIWNYDTLHWATETYSRILYALIDIYLSNLRLKWKWACHLSSLTNATACLKHRICSANRLLCCKCLLSILSILFLFLPWKEEHLTGVGFP